MLELDKIYNMDCLEGMKQLEDNSIDCIITSPPYNQGLTTQDINQALYNDRMDDVEYIEFIKNIFIEFKRLLNEKGSIFYNYKTDVKDNILSTAYEHILKVKDTFLISAEIVWKYAGNFDSARNRFPTDYEMIFQLTKDNIYFFKPKSNMSSLWQFKHVMYGTKEKKECDVHPCPYPIELVKRWLEHTTLENDIILDPYAGSGTTAVACKKLNRKFIGFEINKEYCDIANKRLVNVPERLEKWF